MEQFRVIALCALIFIACSGLGAAASWVLTRTDESVTRREALTAVRGLGASALASVPLPLLVPSKHLWAVGVFFVVHATLLTLLEAAIHRKINRLIKEASDE